MCNCPFCKKGELRPHMLLLGFGIPALEVFICTNCKIRLGDVQKATKLVRCKCND